MFLFSVRSTTTANFIVTLCTMKCERRSLTKLCYITFKVIIIDVWSQSRQSEGLSKDSQGLEKQPMSSHGMTKVWMHQRNKMCPSNKCPFQRTDLCLCRHEESYICHIYSLFTIKLPLFVSLDSVSLLSCGGSIVTKRWTLALKRL